MPKSNRLKHISLLSVLSAFAVVFIHTNGCFWRFSYDKYWISANVIEEILSFAVPVFFMISGATLINYRDRYSTKEYFIKRIKKAVIPYVVWCFIGLFVLLYKGEVACGDIDIFYLIKMVIQCDTVPIYWFFPILFGIYLCIPLFSAVNKELREQVFLYLVFCAFVLNFLLPWLKLILGLDIILPLNISVCSSYVIYVLIGYLLTYVDLKLWNRVLIYIMGLGGLLGQIIGTYYTSIEAGDVAVNYRGFEGVLCVLYASAVFLFVKQVSKYIMQGWFEKLINWMSKYTFGIYLVHYFIMEVVRDLFDRWFNIPDVSLIYRLGAPFIIIPLSILFTLVISKIPFVRIIVGEYKKN